MSTWDVYVYRDGVSRHIGTVQATNEDDARMAALCRYDIGESEEFSVNRR
jgi:hypothetical protein